MLRLIGTDHNQYYAWKLPAGEYLIGRNIGSKTKADFSVADKTVSRKHAQLVVSSSGEECHLTDLDSHNGTFVNGLRISSRIKIEVGDNVQFGQTEFRLTDSDEKASDGIRRRTVIMSDDPPETSVLLSMAEALRPLPARVTEHEEFLPTICDMAKMLVLSEPKEIMLHKSLKLVSKIIPADRLAVLFASEDQSDLYPAATLLPGGKDPGNFTLSKTIVKKIFSDKNAILIANASDDPRFAEQKSIIMSEMRSAMAVPLFDEGEVLGILYADTTNPLHQYNDESLRLFATIANIMASRLNNYTLLLEREEKQVYEAEAQRASVIQRTLLPTTAPELPGYSINAVQEQCHAVGGDLYDLTLLPDGSLMFLVADISGKGMGAALLMSNILASFRILYDDDRLSLLKLVRRVSQQLFRHSATENFATLFIGIINPSNHKLTFINAGHNPPLLVNKDGDLKHLMPSGMMIGAFEQTSWSEETIDLEPEDQLVVFTDGVTEAGFDDEDYSDERLEKFVSDHKSDSPKTLADEIMRDINDYMGDAPRSDDITMVIIKRDS